MKNERYKAKFRDKTFVIEKDLPEVGWHLYVCEGHKCTYDYLQDTRDKAMSQAKEEFGVPLETWIETEEENP